MEDSTRLKTSINKRGEYIVEASISFPIFLIAVVVMTSIILMFACIEDANYIVATELRRAAIEAEYADTSLLLPQRINSRIKDNHSQVKELRTIDYRYRKEFLGIDELIAIKIKMRMKINNPLNFASESNYDIALVTRAYVGKERIIFPMTEEEMSRSGAEAVFVFPKRGEKYHTKDCVVMHAASTSTILSKNLKSKYKACPKCHSKKAELGSLVYIFENDGESYHLPGCETLERNYVEMSRAVAIRRGYEPCLKCGG